MAGRNIFGSSFSMSNEFDFKGSSTQVRSKSRYCSVIKRSDIKETTNASLFAPLVLGAMPICIGNIVLSPLTNFVLGATSVAGSIQLKQNVNGLILKYAFALLKVVNGATAKSGRLTEDELKARIMLLISQMLENAGPGFSSWKQILIDTMQNGTIQDFMKGVQSTVCAITGDPINANTGNFIYEKEDLLIPGKIPLSFKRFYNRIDTRSGSIGKGWRHNYEIELFIEKDRYIILWEDGREELYFRSDDGTPEPLFGGFCRLNVDDDEYCYLAKNKVKYIFNREGKLLKMENQNEMVLSFVYDEKGRLLHVTNRFGVSLSYKYEVFTGRLSQVIDQAGREVKFTYELGRLKEVITVLGFRYTYYYDANNNINQIRNPRGVNVLKNDYDSQGRTVKQYFADSGELTYEYQKDLSRTLMTEQNGNKIAYVHDEKFRNVKTVYSDGEETFNYNDRNQLISKTDKNENITKFSYDDKGNLSQIIYPDGEKHKMTYDSDGHILVKSVNGTLKKKCTYDAKGNLVKITNALGAVRELIYDDNNNITKIKEPDGSVIFIEYDANGNVVRVLGGVNNCTSYEYDEYNRINRIVDGNGNPTFFSYNANNQITSIINAAGKRRIYEYTKNGYITKIIDFDGSVITQEYNNMNKIESFIIPDGGRIRLEYDLMQNVTRKILPNGATVSYVYNKFNQLEQIKIPTGGSISYEYDIVGNRTAVVDPNGNRTVIEYDERNRINKITDSAGASTEYEYDMFGQLVSIKNPMGKIHTYQYNEAGQISAETDISGNTTYYDYTEMGKISCVTDPLGRKMLLEYASGGILTKIIYPDGTFTQYEYDKNGNLILQKNQNGDCLEYFYDCLNRKIMVKSSFGQEKRYEYNEVGNITAVTDSLGNTTRYTYSAGSRMTSVIDAVGNRTEYAYDAMGKLIAICQHEGDRILLQKDGTLKIANPIGVSNLQLTTYKRNLLGKIEQVINPLGLKENYLYNQAGQLVEKIDRDGYETLFAYNTVGDIARITYSDGRSIQYTYNPLRQLIEVKDWLGELKIFIDEVGRLSKVTDYKGREVSYRWGMMGEQKSLTYPDGETILYHYDELLRLNKLTVEDKEIQYHYNDAGKLVEKILPAGITSHYEYNTRGLLSSLTHRKEGVALEQYIYEYDLAGNKTSMIKRRRGATALQVFEESLQNECGYYQYSYDNLYRLTEVIKNKKTLRQYDYDAFGNRIKQVVHGETSHHYYNTANQLVRKEGVFPEESYKYDGRGNLTTVISGVDIVNQYIYDESNRLEESYNAKGDTAKYQYDGMGNRTAIFVYGGLRQSANDETVSITPTRSIEYLLDITKLYRNLLEKTETANGQDTFQRYIWDSNVELMTETAATHIYLQDDLGSTLRLIRATDNHQTIYGYDEFGVDMSGNQGESQPFGYTGYQKDSISNTYFAQAREYLPQAGRFCGIDLCPGIITGPQTLNLYGYCRSNPLNWVDLDGQKPQKSGGEDWWNWIFEDSKFINNKGDNSKDRIQINNVKDYGTRAADFGQIKRNSRELLFDSAKGLYNGAQTVDRIVDANLEVGFGLGGNAHWGMVEGEATVKPLFFETDEHGNITIKSEGTAKTNVLEDLEVGGTVGYDFMSAIPYGSAGIGGLEFDKDIKYSIGGDLYLGIGGGGKVTINITELEPYIKKIFGCDSQN